MRNSNNLSSNIVVESVHTVGVDEAIANPQAGLYAFCHLISRIQTFTFIMMDRRPIPLQ